MKIGGMAVKAAHFSIAGSGSISASGTTQSADMKISGSGDIDATLNALRSYLSGDFPVWLEAPSQVSLLPYSNHTLIVESFRDQPVEVTVLAPANVTSLKNLQTGASLKATVRPPQSGHGALEAPSHEPLSMFTLTVPPHSYVALGQSR